MYIMIKEELLKYKRTFDPSVTKEIRLFGLRGKDAFFIKGSNNDQIKISIIGGEDDDEVVNRSGGGKVFAYDDLKGMDLDGKIKDMKSNDLATNEYERESYQYNTSLPTITLGSTVDDGFWIGGGLSWVNHGWRKSPYKSKQSISFSAAVTSGTGFNFNYDAHFPRALGKIDFYPNVNLSFPEYENFFGLGNDTGNPLREIEYHWVRKKDINIMPSLGYPLGNKAMLLFGPVYQFRQIENSINRVSSDVDLGFSEDVFDSRHFGGAQIAFNFDLVDSRVVPTNGLRLNFSTSHLIESSKSENVTLLNASGQFYLKLLNKPQVVLANQVGYQKASGDLQFYHYADLGNNNGLRGFRNERFRGNSAFYHNIDLRVKLFYWSNRILPMDVGFLTGYDYGRVHLDGETSDTRHHSETIGLWFDLLGSFVLQTYYSFNNDQNTFSLQAGFNF